ncbi:MAG: hypothetical protein M1509_07515 [Nitrospirae bacterium]|nr:hypothetical protein [Nitrospirota bacterium]
MSLPGPSEPLSVKGEGAETKDPSHISSEGSSNSVDIARAAEDFFFEVSSLLAFLYPEGEEEHTSLSLARVEEMDLRPLLQAQAAVDRIGAKALSTLPLPDLLVLSHRLDRLSSALAPFAASGGPLASRIAAITGQGPHGAYRKAGRDSGPLFERKILGRA